MGVSHDRSMVRDTGGPRSQKTVTEVIVKAFSPLRHPLPPTHPFVFLSSTSCLQGLLSPQALSMLLLLIADLASQPKPAEKSRTFSSVLLRTHKDTSKSSWKMELKGVHFGIKVLKFISSFFVCFSYYTLSINFVKHSALFLS